MAALLAIAAASVAACRRGAPPDLREPPLGTWLAAYVDFAKLRDGDLPPEVAKVLGGCGLDRRAGYLAVAATPTRLYAQTRARVSSQQVRCALAGLELLPSAESLRHDVAGDRLVASFEIDAGARVPLDERELARYREAREAEPVALAVHAGAPADPPWDLALAGRDLDLTLPTEESAFGAFGGAQLAVDDASTLAATLDGTLVRYHAAGGLFGEDATSVVRRRVVDGIAIPGPAMEPTLVTGDIVAFVKPKLAGEPTRGDIVVFTREGHDFVRRVLGVPGDRVGIARGSFSLDGKPVPTRILALDHRLVDRGVERQRWSETVGAMSYEITKLNDTSPDDRELVVPSAHLYVTGDARADSGRELVPAAAVRGRALLVAWSRGDTGVRWDRIGRWLGRPAR
ncbi:MAG: signal peptidase I [Deltaproteobacteria bacterium]|nr:signal peptidase I [Deltaproteobacteria bacterium]